MKETLISRSIYALGLAHVILAWIIASELKTLIAR